MTKASLKRGVLLLPVHQHYYRVKCYLLTVFLIIVVQGSSQGFDTTGLGSYSCGTIVRLHDVAARVNLTSAEKLTLAAHFEAEEQQLRALVVSGAPISTIDSVKRYNQSVFRSILPTSTVNNYYVSKTAARANTIATLSARMLKEKYNTDSITEGYFKTIYNWREALIEQQWESAVDTTVRNSNLFKVVIAYDTLLSRYINASAGGRYYNGKIYLLDSLTTVDSSRKNNLAYQYYSGCATYRFRSFADNFKAAFINIFNRIEDTLYYGIAFKQEVLQQTATSTETAMASYIKTKQLSSYTAQEIAPLVAGRERALCLISMVYNKYTPSKDTAVDNVLGYYQPLIDSIIALDGKLENATQIEIAIKYATELDLNTDQIGQLRDALRELNYNIEQYRHEDPVGVYDSKRFESEVLNNTLTADQYTQVLTVKYQGMAASMAKTDWQQMIEYQMTTDYDSATVHLELSNYHLATLIAYYRYAFKPEDQYLAVRRIQDVMPEVYRLLLERWEYRTPYSNTPDVFFQW